MIKRLLKVRGRSARINLRVKLKDRNYPRIIHAYFCMVIEKGLANSHITVQNIKVFTVSAKEVVCNANIKSLTASVGIISALYLIRWCLKHYELK